MSDLQALAAEAKTILKFWWSGIPMLLFALLFIAPAWVPTLFQ